ncbi:hypothetical protein [Streptomyces sp. NPDC006309]|uniref:hypothetical protein n=1 Tax=Streptomyces sp. NPDC006309 TaxID=3156749 RepID=UPI0033A6666F
MTSELPDVPYAEYAQIPGLKGSYCDKPNNVGKAWGEALASEVPVVLACKAGNEIAPIPPHIVGAQGEKAAKAAVHDPERAGIAARGASQKPTETAEQPPGRHS